MPTIEVSKVISSKMHLVWNTMSNSYAAADWSAKMPTKVMAAKVPLAPIMARLTKLNWCLS